MKKNITLDKSTLLNALSDDYWVLTNISRPYCYSKTNSSFQLDYLQKTNLKIYDIFLKVQTVNDNDLCLFVSQASIFLYFLLLLLRNEPYGQKAGILCLQYNFS